MEITWLKCTDVVRVRVGVGWRFFTCVDGQQDQTEHQHQQLLHLLPLFILLWFEFAVRLSPKSRGGEGGTVSSSSFFSTSCISPTNSCHIPAGVAEEKLKLSRLINYTLAELISMFTFTAGKLHGL